MKRHTLALVALIAVSGCLTGTSTTTTSGGDAAELLSADSEVRNEFGTQRLYITGRVRANQDLSYAEVETKFYNSDGEVIASSIDNINDLDAGETWKYEVMYTGTNASQVAETSTSLGETF